MPGTNRPRKSADRGSRRVGSEHAVGLAWRPFIADISDGHGKDRRQQQAVHEAPGDQLIEALRQRRHGGWNQQQCHGGDDDALAAEHVGQHAGERRGRRDREGAGGDDRARLGGADAELLRHHRQHRLRRIEVQECADGGEGDGDATRISAHGPLHSY